MSGLSLATPYALSVRDSVVCSFVIMGEPVPWARARGGAEFGGFYTAKRQRDFKRQLKDFARCGALEFGTRHQIANEPLCLCVRVFLPVPRVWERKRPAQYAEAMAGGLCRERPDLDNWVKLPMDALNGIVWQDDAQVAEFGNGPGTFGKWHDHERPRIEVDVLRASGHKAFAGPLA